MYLSLPTLKAVLGLPCCGEAHPACWKMKGTWRVEATQPAPPTGPNKAIFALLTSTPVNPGSTVEPQATNPQKHKK